MPKYINLETTLAGIENVLREKSDKKDSLAYFAFRLFAETLKKAPTADVVEVKHGEWKPKHYEGGFMDGTNFEECSICRYRKYFDDIRFKLTFDYCPKCGAKMDLKEGANNV